MSNGCDTDLHVVNHFVGVSTFEHHHHAANCFGGVTTNAFITGGATMMDSRHIPYQDRNPELFDLTTIFSMSSRFLTNPIPRIK